MQDKRNLYNQALTAVGAAPNVSDPNDTSKSTEILNLWFPVARRLVFTSFHWASLRATKRLARALTRNESLPWANTDPSPEYSYAYGLPSDMVQPQYLEDFSRFRLGTVGEEKLLMSNNPAPILTYTKDNEDPSVWEPDLYLCVIWSLAACINMAKSGKMNITQKLEQQVQQLIDRAAVNGANEDDTYFETPPSSWYGTGFAIPLMEPRYYYPTSSFRVSGVVA